MSQTAHLRDIFHMDILSDVSISGNLSVTESISSKYFSFSHVLCGYCIEVDTIRARTFNGAQGNLTFSPDVSEIIIDSNTNLIVGYGCTLFCKEPFGFNENDNVYCPLSNMLVRTYKISFADGNSSCYQQLDDCTFSGYSSKPMHAPLLQMVGDKSGKIVYPDYSFTKCETTGGYVGVTITINGALTENEFTLSVF